MDKRAKFIVMEGLDGSGKGTQVKLLQQKLQGQNVFFTREPGGTDNALAEEIRTMLLRQGGPPSTPRTDLHLFFASRAVHMELTVEPRRLQGIHVVSDRYASSTYAFQIYGEEQYELKKIFDESLQDLVAFAPTLYIVLDLPPEVAYLRRKKDDEQAKSKFDIKPLEYHERVREGYKAFAKKYGPVEFVDADRPIEAVHEDIWKLVSEHLSLN
jgi:dTMP kinase